MYLVDDAEGINVAKGIVDGVETTEAEKEERHHRDTHSDVAQRRHNLTRFLGN